jgi:hypothetical protein
VCIQCYKKQTTSGGTSNGQESDGNDSDFTGSSIFKAPKRRIEKKKTAKSSPSVETKVSKQLHTWLMHYFSMPWDADESSRGFRPPLYFQHDGHSRTIVGQYNSIDFHNNAKYNTKNLGLEEMNEKKSLIVFDPANSGSNVYNHLIEDLSSKVSNGKWKTLVKRGLHTITKKQYQVVFIKPGLMSKSEREASKLFISEDQS